MIVSALLMLAMLYSSVDGSTVVLLNCPNSTTPIVVSVQLQNNTDYVISNCTTTAINSQPVRFFLVTSNASNITLTVEDSLWMSFIFNATVSQAALTNVTIRIRNVTNYYSSAQRGNSNAIVYFNAWSSIVGLTAFFDSVTVVNSTQPSVFAMVSNIVVQNVAIALSNILVQTLFATAAMFFLDTASLPGTFTNMTLSIASVRVEYLSPFQSSLSLNPIFLMQITKVTLSQGSISITNASIVSNTTFPSTYVAALTSVTLNNIAVSVTNLTLDFVSPLNTTARAASSIYVGNNNNLQVLRMAICPTQSSSITFSNVQVVVQYNNVTLLDISSTPSISNSNITVVNTLVQSSNAKTIGLSLALISFTAVNIVFSSTTIVGAYETAIVQTDTVSLVQILLNMSWVSRVGNSQSTPWISTFDAGSVVIFRTSNISSSALSLSDVTSTSNVSYEPAFGIRATRMQIYFVQVKLQRCSWHASAVYGLLNAAVQNLTVSMTNSTFLNISIALFSVFTSQLASSTFTADDGTVTAIGTPEFRYVLPFALSLNITSFTNTLVSVNLSPASLLAPLGMVLTEVQQQTIFTISLEAATTFTSSTLITSYGVLLVAIVGVNMSDSSVVLTLPRAIYRTLTGPLSRFVNASYAFLVNSTIVDNSSTISISGSTVETSSCDIRWFFPIIAQFGPDLILFRGSFLFKNFIIRTTQVIYNVTQVAINALTISTRSSLNISRIQFVHNLNFSTNNSYGVAASKITLTGGGAVVIDNVTCVNNLAAAATTICIALDTLQATSASYVTVSNVVDTDAASGKHTTLSLSNVALSPTALPSEFLVNSTLALPALLQVPLVTIALCSFSVTASLFRNAAITVAQPNVPMVTNLTRIIETVGTISVSNTVVLACPSSASVQQTAFPVLISVENTVASALTVAVSGATLQCATIVSLSLASLSSISLSVAHSSATRRQPLASSVAAPQYPLIAVLLRAPAGGSNAVSLTLLSTLLRTEVASSSAAALVTAPLIAIEEVFTGTQAVSGSYNVTVAMHNCTLSDPVSDAALLPNASAGAVTVAAVSAPAIRVRNLSSSSVFPGTLRLIVDEASSLSTSSTSAIQLSDVFRQSSSAPSDGSTITAALGAMATVTTPWSGAVSCVNGWSTGSGGQSPLSWRVVAVAYNDGNHSPSISVVVSEVVMYGPTTVVALSGAGIAAQALLRVDVNCSYTARHAFSPLELVASRSGRPVVWPATLPWNVTVLPTRGALSNACAPRAGVAPGPADSLSFTETRTPPHLPTRTRSRTERSRTQSTRTASMSHPTTPLTSSVSRSCRTASLRETTSDSLTGSLRLGATKTSRSQSSSVRESASHSQTATVSRNSSSASNTIAMRAPTRSRTTPLTSTHSSSQSRDISISSTRSADGTRTTTLSPPGSSSASATHNATSTKSISTLTNSATVSAATHTTTHTASIVASQSVGRIPTPSATPTSESHSMTPLTVTLVPSRTFDSDSASATASPTASPSPTRTQSRTTQSPTAATLVLSLTRASPTPTRTAPVAAPGDVFVTPPTLQAAALSAAVAAVLPGSAPGDASLLAALAMISCGGHATWDSNTGVQRLVISVFYDLGPVVSLWGNVALSLLVLVLQSVAVAVHRRCSSRAATGSDSDGDSLSLAFVADEDAPPSKHTALAVDAPHGGLKERHAVKPSESVLRYPSLSYVAFCFLLPGTLFAAMSCFSEENRATYGSRESVASGALGFVVNAAVAAASVWYAARRVWPPLWVIPTHRAFQEHLPPRVYRLIGWTLPPVRWQPDVASQQGSAFFATISVKKLLWMQPVLQFHSTVFSVVAAAPFPSGVCAVQFTLLALLLVLPIALISWHRFAVLRRPPSNVLVVCSDAISIGVVVATAVAALGPASSADGATEALRVFSALLVTVTVVKVAVTLVSIIAEERVKKLSKEQSVADRESQLDNLSGVSFTMSPPHKSVSVAPFPHPLQDVDFAPRPGRPTDEETSQIERQVQIQRLDVQINQALLTKMKAELLTQRRLSRSSFQGATQTPIIDDEFNDVPTTTTKTAGIDLSGHDEMMRTLLFRIALEQSPMNSAD
ncbi:membrane-associated protein, putative [Bodo saltans]|uniref:Membrane-associated protein, putative n=1 Tax=Bodo saltans TaxID=75058 RepID=A0A0S4JR54_BODSA|nr:membrane-associated protein, putative [Bodo saltans]|eukprot:CUG94005.1 membrane-associated protein, putative [Bodo saltans]